MQFTRSLILLCTGAALAAAVSTEPKSVGCFTDLTSTTETSDDFNTVSMCHTFCSSTTDHFALQGMSCLCLDELPEAKSKVDDKKCDVACPGFPTDECGGKKEFTVYSGNKKVADDMNYDASTTSSSAKPSTTSTSESASATASASASASTSASASVSATDEEPTESATANSTATASNATETPSQQQDDADSAAGRNVASFAAAAAMVVAGLAML